MGGLRTAGSPSALSTEIAGQVRALLAVGTAKYVCGDFDDLAHVPKRSGWSFTCLSSSALPRFYKILSALCSIRQ
jgi:hypothetical protein